MTIIKYNLTIDGKGTGIYIAMVDHHIPKYNFLFIWTRSIKVQAEARFK